MKQIKRSQSFYRVTEDERKDSFRFGRYLYFIILLTIIGLIFHILFSSLYLAEGQGFVSSDHTVIALEHDSTVQALMVENGDTIQAGQELLFFDSTDFRKELVDLALKRASLSRDFNEKVISRAALDTKIKASKQYHKIMQEVKKGIYKLRKQGLALNSRITQEEERAYEALSSMLEFSADKKEINQQIASLERDLHIAKAHIDELLENFRRGLFVSPVSGVVGNINANNGSVVHKGDPLMKIFSGKKYLLVYFEETGVPLMVGDPVLVHIPGRSYTIGRIVSKSLHSHRLPEELEPTFREPERRIEVVVMVEQDLVKEQPFMTQATVLKPRGIDAMCKVLNCNSHLIDEFAEIKKRRNQEKEVRTLQHEVDMFELFRDKSSSQRNIAVRKHDQRVTPKRNKIPDTNGNIRVHRGTHNTHQNTKTAPLKYSNQNQRVAQMNHKKNDPKSQN